MMGGACPIAPAVVKALVVEVGILVSKRPGDAVFLPA